MGRTHRMPLVPLPTASVAWILSTQLTAHKSSPAQLCRLDLCSAHFIPTPWWAQGHNFTCFFSGQVYPRKESLPSQGHVPFVLVTYTASSPGEAASLWLSFHGSLTLDIDGLLLCHIAPLPAVTHQPFHLSWKLFYFKTWSHTLQPGFKLCS